MIESKNQKLNIKDLAIGDPKREWTPQFDPDKELGQKVWEKIEDDLNVAISRNSGWASVFEILSVIKMVKPEKVADIDLGVSAVDMALRSLEIERVGAGNTTNTLRKIAIINILFPNEKHRIYEDTGDYRKERGRFESRVRKISKGDLNEPEFKNFSTEIRDIKIAFPEDPPGIKILAKSYGKLTDVLTEFKSRHKWSEYVDLAATLRILFPDNFNEIKPTEDMWTDAMSDFRFDVVNFELAEKLNDNSVLYSALKRRYKFLSTAMNLKILSAGNMTVKDQGLEFVATQPEQGVFSKEPAPVPTRRMF
jgi:hypothetical protein